MKVLCIILLLWGLANAGIPDEYETTTAAEPIHEELEPDNIITNGYAAPDGHSPHLVSIAINIPNSQNVGLCGGSIISNTWVLTAAHCVVTTPFVDVYYGSNWRWQGVHSVRVTRNNFILHNFYPSVYGHDIALIRTPHVGFTNRINKINLPPYSQRNERYENWWTLACGWGGMANGRLADWLQCVDVQVMGNTECRRSYREIVESTMCIRTPGGRSTCGGDSGGPLTTHSNTRLVGITSFGSSAGCTVGMPAAFTRVSSHLDWIRQQTGIYYQ